MAFNEVKERIATKATEKPFSVRLKIMRSTNYVRKPVFFLSIRSAMLAQLDWKKVEKVSLSIGDGEHAGKIRVSGDMSGIGVLRRLRSFVLIDFGYVRAFGDKSTDNVPCDGRLIDGTTVEIDLPDFAAAAASCEDDEEEEAPTPKVSKPKVSDEPLKPAAPAQAKATPDRPPTINRQPPPAAPKRGEELASSLEKEGVRLTGGTRPILCHDGDRLELTPRQAKIMAPLVRAIGGMLPTPVLIEKAGLPPSAGASMISDDYMALKDSLAELGLKFTHTPKMGYTLAKL